MLASPSFLELAWSEVPQGGVDSLAHVDVVQKSAQLNDSVSIVFVLRQVNLLLFDGPHKPLCVSILPGLTDLRHADFGLDSSEHVDVGCGSVLDPL